MEERDWLARRFEEQRPHLRAMAYRMLGSMSDADDAVQEAWIRLNRTEASEVENLGGWLTTVAARISLNILRSRQTRRESNRSTSTCPIRSSILLMGSIPSTRR
jgi:RNA polymerase sigma-70 factor (ECF subfamily)